ncbi:MAG: response regulator [Bryobacteraceae bacterium]
MPAMDGKELADRLRTLRRNQDSFVSGYAEIGIVHQGVLHPGTDFLHKPFTPDSLAEKVRDVLEPAGGFHDVKFE